jgi:hypothetical protein
MTQEREDYMRRQEADHNLLRMRTVINRGFSSFTNTIQSVTAQCQQFGRGFRTSQWHQMQSDPCDEFDHERIRPAGPLGKDDVWYRGWEVGYDMDADGWGAPPWRAYKGGVDLDARSCDGRTFKDVLDAIDEAEDE